MKQVYADTAATTRPHPDVVGAMLPYLGAAFGNASSVHRRGEGAREAIEQARLEVARLLAAQPEEIVFTASGSEANNLALQGVLRLAEGPRRRLVVSAIEHSSVLECARALEAAGFPLTILPVQPNGVLDPATLEASLGADVALVSVMAVNNETGVLQAIGEMGTMVRESGAKFHVDAVQAVGRVPIHVDGWNADLVSTAAHKFHGPLGAGALFVRRRTRLTPLVYGGQHERGRRAGTENLAAIVGMGAAATLTSTRLEQGAPEQVARLAEALLAELLMRVPDTRLNGDLNRRAGHIVNVCFAGVDGEAVLHELDLAGVTVSTGSACSSAHAGPSHVLTAMGLAPEDAHASVRFSIDEDTTADDIAHIGQVTPPIIERLRSLAGPGIKRSA